MMLVDYALLISVLLLTLSIHFGYWYFPEGDLIWLVFGVPIIGIVIFKLFGLYRIVIRYIGFNTLWNIFQAVSIYILLFSIIGFIVKDGSVYISIVFINWVLSLLVIAGLRIITRWLMVKNANNNCKKVLIYGAGNAGIQLASALEHSFEYNPVGFIDDAKELQGKFIRGLNVYSIIDILGVINKIGVSEVLIAIPSASRAKRINIINALESYPVLVRILPGVAELAEGKINIDDLREIDIKDLLGREIVKANKELLCKDISNKIVAVTGAGGSIGSELCRQVVFLKPKALILYEMSEIALYTIEKELSRISPNLTDVYPILGSVNNKNQLINIFKQFSVDTIYHSAAYKHVPIVEFNNIEGANNNIFGTLSCAQAAIDTGVKTFVLISTDKAVRPANTMGATKRSAELVLQALSVKQSNTKFTMVRFGNVLDSSGSVIPLFKKQIKEGGPVTVTDAKIIRYFMTIPEAVELVIQAGSMGSGGDVFVLDMGKPVRINDLAKKMIHLSGLEVKDESNLDGDIEIKYTGLRPGEKLYEELLIGNNISDTNNPLIMRAEEEMIAWDELEPILKGLNDAVVSFDQEKLRKLLIKLVPEFHPQCDIQDILYKKKNDNKFR